jgi:hypothetical protein
MKLRDALQRRSGLLPATPGVRDAPEGHVALDRLEVFLLSAVQRAVVELEIHAGVVV